MPFGFKVGAGWNRAPDIQLFGHSPGPSVTMLALVLAEVGLRKVTLSAWYLRSLRQDAARGFGGALMESITAPQQVFFRET
mmetsp:Transcript_33013/g.65416  ORF Transcript_33013/g.65416 Transcript_33013/m.65416 type:complete len:81 (+) Transcript_33013:251-493(+)